MKFRYDEVFRENNLMNNSTHPSLLMPPDLLLVHTLVYGPLRLTITQLTKETESSAYNAFDFTLNEQRVKFRSAKITPTKIGQFVTLWKRIGKGPILPFDHNDPIDVFIISVRNAESLGQFVFPKTLLSEKKILAQAGKGGKRAMRVYPAWDKPTSRQALQTQAWQLPYFFAIQPHSDLLKAQALLQPAPVAR